MNKFRKDSRLLVPSCLSSGWFQSWLPVSRWMRFGLVLIGLLSATFTPAAATGLHVGMVKSFFQDVPEPVAKALLIPFGTLMQQHTDLSGQIATIDGPFALADQLDKGKMDLGMFQGFEFAWAQVKFPKLRPLMIAINQKTYLSVHVVTRSDSNIAHFEDLKGKQISLPWQSGGHCRLFVERHCEKSGLEPAKYFGKIIKHQSVEAGLDDVVRGKVDAIIVDCALLDCYKIVKPGCISLLKTVESSPLFPSAVMVYRDGALPQKTLDAFHKGMAKANKDPASRGVMTLWKLTAFAPVPADYQEALDKIRATYPGRGDM